MLKTTRFGWSEKEHQKVSVRRQDQNNYSETEQDLGPHNYSYHIHSLDEDGFHDNMGMHVKWCFVSWEQ